LYLLKNAKVSKTKVRMKHLFIILTVLVSGTLWAQGEAAFFNAIKSGNQSTIENYLSNRVELCIFENQQMLPKKTASLRIGDFLNNNKVSQIDVIHQGTSRDKTSNFKVAKLTTNQGEFRLFVYFLGTIADNTIKEVRIDKF